MLADVGVLAEDAAQVGDAEGDKTDWSADAYGRSHEEHYHQEAKRLAEIGKLGFATEMARQVARPEERCGESGGEKAQGEHYVAGGHALEVEIGRTPEIVLLEQVAVGGVGHHDGAERADEGAEQDAESDEVLRGNLHGDDEANQRADQRADEASNRQRTPAAHGRGGGTQTGGAAKAEAVDIAQLIAPQILHLYAADRQGDAADKNVQQTEHYSITLRGLSPPQSNLATSLPLERSKA